MRLKISLLAIIMNFVLTHVIAQPGSAEEPARFVGNLDVAFDRPDGKLPPVIGAQNYQVLRSVRSDTSFGDGLGFTLHHHPMLSYWNDNFYVLYNACPEHEERGLTEILFSRSKDGMNWSKPDIIFPHVVYKGEPTFSNHRMGFYITPSGRLLATTAYFPQSEMIPQKGSEDTAKKYFGVVVREIRQDGTFGEIFFIARNNSLYQEDEFPYPYYKASADPVFVSDCNSLRNDRLITLHWWEQLRPEDFSFPKSLTEQIVNGNRKFAKAISYYRRPDGAIVAFWKNSKSAISHDQGKTWSKVVDLKTFSDGYAKVWAQRTNDGRYAASWQPLGEGSWGRYPMLWATSDDGITYEQAMHVNGEVTMRYEGGSKNIGPCNYQRGLYENGADIPGDDVWVVYSMSKEDIWISRIPVPMKEKAVGYINQDFESIETTLELERWNIFHPAWAPVTISQRLSEKNTYMKFSDRDPFDYAKAFRVFKESKDELVVQLNVLAEQNDHGRFEIDLGNTEHLAPIRISFTPNGKIEIEHWKYTSVLADYQAGKWNQIQLKIDIAGNRFSVTANNVTMDDLVFNSRKVKTLDRITFRTGNYRGISINPVEPEKDLPLRKEAVYFLDDVRVDIKKIEE
ncbi:sialidase family protein [Cyclobacterium xiamenense]|uniref:sialidase family protein n=1 Tax=Cyclobacterium xiamenense TaxID=1297121 RepID=UPI0012BA2616|nr:sialidase family protein [Cyclobacterium xiamenense]